MNITSKIAILTPAAFALALAAAVPVMSQTAGTDNPEAKAEADPRTRTLAARKRLIEANQSPRVIGGDPAKKDEFPFQVALLDTGTLDDSKDSQYQAQFCGGSLISDEWVLTAAHCMVDEWGEVYPTEWNTVLVGATSLVDDAERIVAAEVYVKEDYDPITFDNDVALIKLSKKVKAKSIQMTDGSDITDAGKAMVIGWGLRDDGSAPVELLKGEVGMFPNATCNDGIRGYFADGLQQMLLSQSHLKLSEADVTKAMEILGPAIGDPLTQQMVCAGTQSGEVSSCHGDSGGPLFVNTPKGAVQVGIVSWGAGPLNADMFCGHENAYAVFSRVSSFNAWVKEKTGL